MSNAPCLDVNNGRKCYRSVVKNGYCAEHQRPAFFGGSYKQSPDWANKKATVLRRDKGVCYLCGGIGADSVDHVKPKSQGGTDSLFNLKAVHDRVAPYCHQAKSQEEARYGRELASKPVKRGARFSTWKRD